ncbi:CAAX protease self-immunity protein [Toxoplasma gondii VAND]|uniref:CAAX protease self-immunity protein n=1 Tax=Toxoplasma gondii VAND TaxID=933077 RepID=A0A086PJM6_TOXGO|nr:CAAX protease self-immunity protein [Toxoplasma gondii VAND]
MQCESGVCLSSLHHINGVFCKLCSLLSHLPSLRFRSSVCLPQTIEKNMAAEIRSEGADEPQLHGQPQDSLPDAGVWSKLPASPTACCGDWRRPPPLSPPGLGASVRPTAAPSTDGEAGPQTPSTPGEVHVAGSHYTSLSPPLSPPPPTFSRSGSWLTFLAPTAPVTLSIPVLLVVGFAPVFCMILFIVGLHSVLLAMVMMHWLCMLLVPLLYIYFVERSFEYYRHVWKIQRCRFRYQWPWAAASCITALGGVYAAYVCAKAVGGSWFAGVVEGARFNCLSEGLDIPFPLLLVGGVYFFVVNPVVEEWFWRVFLYREFGGAVFVSAPDGVLYMHESDPLLLSWCLHWQTFGDAATHVGATAAAVPPTSSENTPPPPSLTLSPSRFRSAFGEARASGQSRTAAAIAGALVATTAEQGNCGELERHPETRGRSGTLSLSPSHEQMSNGHKQWARHVEAHQERESLSDCTTRVFCGHSEAERAAKPVVCENLSSSAAACIGAQRSDAEEGRQYLGDRCEFAPGDGSETAHSLAAMGNVGLERLEEEGTWGGGLRVLPDTIDEEDPERCPSPSAPVMTHVEPGVLQVDVRLSASGQAMLALFYASYHAVVFSTTVGVAYGFVAIPCVAALGLLLTFFRNSSRFGILTGVFTHVGVDAAVVAILADVLQLY